MFLADIVPTYSTQPLYANYGICAQRRLEFPLGQGPYKKPNLAFFFPSTLPAMTDGGQASHHTSIPPPSSRDTPSFCNTVVDFLESLSCAEVKIGLLKKLIFHGGLAIRDISFLPSQERPTADRPTNCLLPRPIFALCLVRLLFFSSVPRGDLTRFNASRVSFFSPLVRDSAKKYNFAGVELPQERRAITPDLQYISRACWKEKEKYTFHLQDNT